MSYMYLNFEREFQILFFSHLSLDIKHETW